MDDLTVHPIVRERESNTFELTFQSIALIPSVQSMCRILAFVSQHRRIVNEHCHSVLLMMAIIGNAKWTRDNGAWSKVR